MKQLSVFATVIWICFAFCISSQAQSSLSTDQGFSYELNTEFINRMNYIFGNLEKDRIPWGILQDYAMEFTNLDNYKGILSDTNKISAEIWKDIYTTMAMGAMVPYAYPRFHPNYLDSLWQSQRQPGIITIAGLYMQYARLRQDAYDAGLISIDNDRLFDKYVNGVWQNPYEIREVFAMAPSVQSYKELSFQVLLPANLWLNNAPFWFGSLSIDFGDGAGYRTLTPGQATTVTYNNPGVKSWKYRLSLSYGVVLYSHSEVEIFPVLTPAFNNGVESFYWVVEYYRSDGSLYRTENWEGNTIAISLYAPHPSMLSEYRIFKSYGRYACGGEVYLGDKQLGYVNNCYDSGCDGFVCFTVYPNPASSELNLEIQTFSSLQAANASSGEASQSMTTDKKESYEVQLISQMGKMEATVKFETKKKKIDLKKIPNGNYVLHLIHSKGKISKHIVVKK